MDLLPTKILCLTMPLDVFSHQFKRYPLSRIRLNLSYLVLCCANQVIESTVVPANAGIIYQIVYMLRTSKACACTWREESRQYIFIGPSWITPSRKVSGNR